MPTTTEPPPATEYHAAIDKGITMTVTRNLARTDYMHAPADLDGAWLRNAVMTRLAGLHGAEVDIVAAAAVHEVLRHLRTFAMAEGSGVGSEYELGQFLLPVAHVLNRHTCPEDYVDESPESAADQW